MSARIRNIGSAAVAFARSLANLWRIWLSFVVGALIFQPMYLWLVSLPNTNVPSLILGAVAFGVGFFVFTVVLAVLYEIRAFQQFSAQQRRQRLAEE